ncbi:MAG: hypothetical protein WBW03_09630, partial [Silvibacterium sp.]
IKPPARAKIPRPPMTPPEYRSHRLHHDKLPRDFSAGEKPGLGLGQYLAVVCNPRAAVTPAFSSVAVTSHTNCT